MPRQGQTKGFRGPDVPPAPPETADAPKGVTPCPSEPGPLASQPRTHMSLPGLGLTGSPAGRQLSIISLKPAFPMFLASCNDKACSGHSAIGRPPHTCLSRLRTGPGPLRNRAIKCFAFSQRWTTLNPKGTHKTREERQRARSASVLLQRPGWSPNGVEVVGTARADSVLTHAPPPEPHSHLHSGQRARTQVHIPVLLTGFGATARRAAAQTHVSCTPGTIPRSQGSGRTPGQVSPGRAGVEVLVTQRCRSAGTQSGPDRQTELGGRPRAGVTPTGLGLSPGFSENP